MDKCSSATGGPLRFEPKYYADRLHVINPTGDVGIISLWTPIKTALEYLQRIGVDLDPISSRIAVLGNLYGDGLPQLAANLLWNPQITAILVFGQDLSGSSEEIVNLLLLGAEPADRFGQSRNRIINTDRYLDPTIPVDLLVGQYEMRAYRKPSEATTFGIQNFFSTLRPQRSHSRDRIECVLQVNKPRYFPSEPRSHTIVRKRPLDAWEEVVCQTLRFGVPSIASKTKERLELQNMKVVITDPVEESDEHLRKYGFSSDEMTNYQTQLLDAKLPEGLSYSYGNRIRGYWGKKKNLGTIDFLMLASMELQLDTTSRGAYFTLWDPRRDNLVGEDESTPCLVSLFFRVFNGELTLTATFRAHNVMSAWLKNIYGLIALQKFVSLSIGPGIASRGAITIISHSISIDPTALEKYDLAQQILRSKTDELELDRETGKRNLREDPNGYFVFTVDRDRMRLVVDHRAQGELLTRYEGKTAEDVSSQLARDNTISDISHALYVGRQLAIHEGMLKT